MLMKFCKNKKVGKFLAIMLVITLTFANIAFLGKNLISYALDTNLEAQGTNTQHNNVKFDAYISDNSGNNVHSVTFDAINNIQKLNLYFSVQRTGYLKEAYVDFRDETNGLNTNYEIFGETINSNLVQNINEGMKTVSLNHINSGTEAVIEVPIKLDFTELMEIDKLNKNSLVTLRGIYVDENGKETQINKTVKLNIGWNIETELGIEQAVTKYIPYNVDGQTGLIIQLSVKVGQINETMALPVKSTELKLKVPKLAEKLPEKISVSANSLMATNGNKQEFTSNDWVYNEEDETVTINKQGLTENGIAWAGTGTDEYFVTYIYSSEVYEEVFENEIALHCEADGEMFLYTAQGPVSKKASSSGDIVLSDKIGDMVTYSIEANKKEMSKGRMYANYNSEEKMHDTEYTTTIKANISNSENVNSININLPTDNFADDENEYTTKIEGIPYTNYKQIVISKSKFQEILGENGYLNLIDEYSNVYTINNQTQDIEGKYIINFGEKIGELTLQTSKPIADGILEINVTKVISKDISYTKEQLRVVKALVVRANDSSDRIALTETSTNAKLEISNTSLATMVENKNVEIKVLLNNNVETSDLYKNAVFEISLPKYIEDIEITSGNILYTSGLEVERAEKNYTENGIVIKIITKGAENDFSTGVFTNGTNIVLNANIKVNTLTPNTSDKIVLTYTNESATMYSNDARDEVEVRFVAPEEMTTFNSVLTSGVEKTSIDGNEQTAKLEILDSQKIATMKMSILNKYSNICNNIRILGRTPFVGNKSISTGADLGTTFDAKLIDQINTNGINAIVYYSDVENATQDLENANNAWTTNFSTLENVKSYLIVLQDYEMQPGQTLDFSYNCQIPESLEHNESAYGTYTVYFDRVSTYVAEAAVEATKVGLTTGVGSNLETSTKIMYQGNEIADGADVREYQHITYQTTVKNTGSVDATGVEITANITNASVIKSNGAIIKETTLTGSTMKSVNLFYELGEIKAGEEKTVEYTVKVSNIDAIKVEGLISTTQTDENGNVVTKYYMEYDGKAYEVDIEGYRKVFNATKVTAENFESSIDQNFNNPIKKAEMIVDTEFSSTSMVFTKNIELPYIIDVTNTSGKDLRNVVITYKLPVGLEYVPKDVENSSKVNYDEATKTITIVIDQINANSKKSEKLYVKTTLPDGVGRMLVSTSVMAKADGTENYESNIKELGISDSVLNIDLQSSVVNGSYIREGNKVEFTVTVTNTGEKQEDMAVAEIKLPNQLSVDEAYYYEGEGRVSLNRGSDNSYYAFVTLGKDESRTLKVIATAESYGDAEETRVSVSASINDINSSTFTYIIEKSTERPTNPTDPDAPSGSIEQTYRIAGTAWLDENENGIKDNNEKLLEGIDVMLVDANTGVVVKDKTNGTLKQTKTSSEGTYTFTNLPEGRYIVVFEYDAGYYDVTEFKVNGATDDVTSKAIQSKITKNGKVSIAGITDAILISGSSRANINIGLVVKPKFDLSLDKSISRITVENAAGTNSYDFTNAKLAKVEIPGKYLNNSKVYVEYKIKIKNEGQVPGYASKIVDYVSRDFTFNRNNNIDWYIGTDGNLYNESLSQTIINPGEEKELSLVLLKTMTEDNTGVVTNIAEIYETANEQNLQDFDSTVANRAQEEDDLSNADVLISVKTGQVILYITIAITSIAIIAIGAYIINKKVMKGGRM